MVLHGSYLNRLYYIFLVTICITISFSAAAEEYPKGFSYKGYYKATFSGLLIGKIGIDFEQTANGYTATSDIVSSGILKLFTKHSSHSTVKATGKDFNYTLVEYVTDYRTKKKKRHVEVTYKNGAFATEHLVPPENPNKRKPVPLELKNKSVDLLSALFEARSKLREALAKGDETFTVHAYDGRRLTTVNFTIIGKKVITLYGVKHPVIQVNAKRELTAGFSESEINKYDPDEPSLAMYFSDDEPLFPIRLELDIYMNTLKVDMYKRCAADQSCLLGITN